MAWIESHQSLLRHKKTNRLVALLDVDRFKLIGHLHALWWWALDNVPADGDLGDLSNAEIALAAEWPGPADDWVTALEESGFIDTTPDGRFLHDWYDYAGRLIEDRSRKRRANSERQGEAEQRVRTAIADLRRRGMPLSLNAIVAAAHCSKTTARRILAAESRDALEGGTTPGSVPVRTPGSYRYGTGEPTNQPKREEPVPPVPPPSLPDETGSPPDPADSVVHYLRTRLQEHGQTVFPRDWHRQGHTVAERLLASGLSEADLRAVVDWALQDAFWADKVTAMRQVESAASQWQRQRRTTGPPIRRVEDLPDVARRLKELGVAPKKGEVP